MEEYIAKVSEGSLHSGYRRCKACLFGNRDGVCTQKGVEIRELDSEEIVECWFYRDKITFREDL
jgi:hypothetical protein